MIDAREKVDEKKADGYGRKNAAVRRKKMKTK